MLATFSGVTSAENFPAWDFDEMAAPELKPYLKKAPAMMLNSETLSSTRKAFMPSPESLPKNERVNENERVNVRNETLSSGLRVRVYTPKTEKAEYPALLWIHGGGHILGIPEINEDLSLRIADELGFIVVAPDYRLTPEYPYPADLSRCHCTRC